MCDMSEIKSRSIRLDDENWAWLSGLPGRSANEAVRELRRADARPRDKLDEVLEHLRALPQTFQEAMDEYKARNGKVSTPSVVPSTFAPRAEVEKTAEQFPFHPRCLHCGENFGAWNRNASLCTDCKVARHSGDPARCDVCTAGTAI